MNEYQEFTGKSVEEALKRAIEAFGVGGLNDIDFEILTHGSKGVLGMGAEPARIVAAPRAALGGAAPRREAAAAVPLPTPAREPRMERGERGERGDRGGRDRRPAGDRDRRPERPPRGPAPAMRQAEPGTMPEHPQADRPEPPDRPAGPGRPPRPERGERDRRPASRPAPRQLPEALSAGEQEQVSVARASLSVEREEIQAAEASPEALAAGKDILEKLMELLGYDVTVTIEQGTTSKLSVTGAESEKEALGILIGRKGDRLSALQHLVNLMLSKRMGAWTRVLVDVEEYRGRRERQLQEIAERAAERVMETGKMLQLEPMTPLERRWIHIALRDRPGVATQSIGEEPNRRVVVLRREV
ncbi:MAG: RNA-binding cell elongation regulator Jag/EloR [Candidatus Limnocylindrales bacterium]